MRGLADTTRYLLYVCHISYVIYNVYNGIDMYNWVTRSIAEQQVSPKVIKNRRRSSLTTKKRPRALSVPDNSPIPGNSPSAPKKSKTEVISSTLKNGGFCTLDHGAVPAQPLCLTSCNFCLLI